jgi:hypothetical protein
MRVSHQGKRPGGHRLSGGRPVQYLKMPRPAVLSFARAVPLPDDHQASGYGWTHLGAGEEMLHEARHGQFGGRKYRPGSACNEAQSFDRHAICLR